ncbi:MAG: hypothetical protein QOF32_2583, partial [Gammaproteobacteria bacterium]|nr:hypothetical protein [Gammaproteobacteria bacterium]
GHAAGAGHSTKSLGEGGGIIVFEREGEECKLSLFAV